MNDALRIGLIRANGAWRYRWVGVGVAWVIALISVGALHFFKDRYEASARVHVNTQTVLKPLMAQLAVQPDIDQQVRMLARTLISRPRIEHLIDALDFAEKTDGPRVRERIVNDLVTAIKLEGSTTGNLYTISYRDRDPVRARRLVETLVNLFVESSAVSKRRDSERAREFIDQQIADNEHKLTEAESRLKDFKLKNFGVSGATNQDFFSRMATISDEVNRLRLELNAAEQARDALRRELSSEAPQLPVEALQARVPAGPSELETRLDAQRRILDDLLRRFTDDHPDVMAARRNIAQIEKQRKEEAEAAKAGARGMAPTNPVFQQLRVQLAQSEAQVASLRSQLGVQQGRLDQVRAQASKMPQVEAELAQLNRDYDVIRRNYQQLVERREAASLGIKLDDSAQLADFRIIEPAMVAPKPVFPSKTILALGAVVASIVAGIAAAFAMSLFFPAVFDEKQLQAVSKRPVIGSVSVIRDDAGRRAFRWEMAQFGGATGLLMLGGVAWLVWVVINSRI